MSHLHVGNIPLQTTKHFVDANQNYDDDDDDHNMVTISYIYHGCHLRFGNMLLKTTKHFVITNPNYHGDDDDDDDNMNIMVMMMMMTMIIQDVTCVLESQQDAESASAS